jgi:hypothetical protein
MSSPTRLVCAPLPEMEGSVHLVEFGDASFNAVLGCTHGVATRARRLASSVVPRRWQPAPLERARHGRRATA